VLSVVLGSSFGKGCVTMRLQRIVVADPDVISLPLHV
jgi:hypothetical protein